MDLKHLCMGCMRDKGEEDPCSYCGWQEDTLPDSPAQLPPRTMLLDKYIFGRVLGQGGFGITYLAWDILLNRKLAIKEYYPREICNRSRDALTVQALAKRSREDFQYGLKKFVEEGQNLAQFRDYPGVVSLLDFFEANGTAYIVMAYMEGMNFKQYLETQGGAISFEAALEVLTPVMDALREIHRVGMLHRDISPDNIYLTEDRQVKLLDFGSTRYALRDQSHGLTVLFKPGYAPFEQYSSGGKQGPWTDIYALGATFYRALTNKSPSEAPDRVVNDDLILPSALGVKIPNKSEPALLKALAVKWENRFQRVQDFQEAITPVAPVLVPARKKQQVGWAIAAGLLLVTSLTFFTLWHGTHAANQELHGEIATLTHRIESQNVDIQKLTGRLSGLNENLGMIATEREKIGTESQKQSESLATAVQQTVFFRAQTTDLSKRVLDLSSSLSAMTAERDAWKANSQRLSSAAATSAGRTVKPEPVEPKTASPRIALSVTEVHYYQWAKGKSKGPYTQFRSSETQRVLCEVKGPSPQDSIPANTRVGITFIAPNGVKSGGLFTVQATQGLTTWSAIAFLGNDQTGTIEKGEWKVEVRSGEQLIGNGSFTVV